MQHMNTQSAMARWLIAFNFVAILAVGLAFGQSGQVVRVKVPVRIYFRFESAAGGDIYVLSDQFWAPSANARRRAVDLRPSSVGWVGRPSFFATALLSSIRRTAAASLPRYGCRGRMEYLCTAPRKSTITRFSCLLAL